MKLRFKGIYKKGSHLPKGKLPNNAIKFKEPNNMLQLNILTLGISLIISIAFFILINLIKPLNKIDFNFTNGGLLLFFISIIPHELIHALCFEKYSEVSLYFSPKHFSAFIHSTYPLSKKRFIWMSICPTIFLGIIPFLTCIFVPYIYGVHETLLTFSFYSFIGGSGDYINAVNAATQMPKNSKQQMSEFNSYWFIPS